MADIKKVLVCKKLSKKFGDRYAVKNVNFDIFEGEIFGLIGQNGAGKTTIIRMITGLAKPTEGEVFVCGTSVQKNFSKAIRNVGGIIENPEMYGYMSGMDNLKYFASLYGHIPQSKIEEIVRLVAMERRIYDKVSTYSLGMRQRVGIAQALLHSPKLLILDEPTNGLDPNGIKEMREFLKKIARTQKISILISSHILSEMEQLCDTVGIIDNGEIVDIRTISSIKKGAIDGTKISIKVDYPNYAGKIIIHNFKIPVSLSGKNVIFNLDENQIPKVTATLIKEGVSIYNISTVTKSLEDMFTEIISRKSTKGNIV